MTSRRSRRHPLAPRAVPALLVVASLLGTAGPTSARLREREPIKPLPESPALMPRPAVVLLGRDLFHDPRLSANDTIACASCHVITEGGDDGLAVSVGIDGAVGTINAPTVYNSAGNIGQFWDGRAGSLEEQVAGPVHAPAEMGSSWDEVLGKLRRDAGLVARFEALYEAGLTAETVASAIAAYERALVTRGSPFDAYLRGSDEALSDQAREGYELFKDIGCASCHQGQHVGANMFQHFGVMGDYFADRGNVTEADYGRYNVTGLERDRYRFKVPGLRNVAETAPYFHDGSAETLGEAVQVMALYQLGYELEPAEVDKLVAFLESLTGTIDEDLK